ncbi:MAG: hypothetical protein O2854_10140 [Chloroflexi bacterium]|nr:hypothetical protein [Chloroflexota bacterium]
MSKLMALGWLVVAALAIAMVGCSTADPAAASPVDDSEVRPAPGGAASGAGAATQPDALDETTLVTGPTRAIATVTASSTTEDRYDIVVLLNVAEDIGVSGIEVRAAARKRVEILSVETGPFLGAVVVKGPRYVGPDGLAATTAYARAGGSPKEAIAGVVARFVVSSADGPPLGDDLVVVVTFTDADFVMQPPLAVSLPSE